MQPPRRPASLSLYTLDGRTEAVRLLTNGPALGSIARAAVATGGGHVLEETMVVFPNGAVTLVLVLAESHLSLHTWPEDRLVAIDLFSCGGIEAERVTSALRTGLDIEHATLRRVARGAADDGA